MTVSVKCYLFYPILDYPVKIFWDPDCVSWNFGFPFNLHVVCAYGKTSSMLATKSLMKYKVEQDQRQSLQQPIRELPLESHFTQLGRH